jgi:protein phosphatase 1L
MTYNMAELAEQRFRDYMEDRHSVDLTFGGTDAVFGGVYDGHGGYHVAEYVRTKLPWVFLSKLIKNNPLSAFRKTYWALTRELINFSDDGGACAANFYIKDGMIYHANVGDARIIVVGNGDYVQLTTDHRVNNQRERRRVTKSGSTIEYQYLKFRDRHIMLTRALGDRHYRPGGLISNPTVGRYAIKPTDRYLIAATDGLFDKIRNDEIQKIAKDTTTAAELTRRLGDLVNSLRGSDNLTIVVIEFIQS